MTQPLWTSEEAAVATGGATVSNWQAYSVCIDSRAAEPGSLFVAIIGERVDGHSYVQQAFANGAAAAIVSRQVDGVDASKLLIVDDTLTALEALGKHARARSNAQIIGVTGSVGKTTTKEALRIMCNAFGETYATKGNLNNHYGTPLSLANLAQTAKFGVFEMGMNHAGEIAKLTNMVRPHVAIITTVEAVHLEFFENIQGIAHAKAEIFEGLEPGGTAILNADNEHTELILSLPHTPSPQRGGKLLTFGNSNDADVRFITSAPTADGVKLTLEVGDIPVHVALTSGGIAIESAVMVGLAVASALELDIQKAASTFASFTEVKGRGQLAEVTLDKKTMWWMDDSYNASPAAMRAAFEKLATIKAQKNAPRTVAVLGDMLELGEQGPTLHAELAADLAAERIDELFTVGPLMQHLHHACKGAMPATHADDLPALSTILKDQLRHGDVVLFKGSHGSNIHQLVKELQQ